MGKVKKPLVIGSRYGDWTIRDHTVTNKHHMSQSVVECACGNWSVIINANLREGKSQRCKKCAFELMRKTKPETKPRSNLEESDVQYIRKQLRKGTAAEDLARHYGLSYCTIQNIDRGFTHASVPWPEGMGPRKAKNQARLSTEEVLGVMRRLNAGERVTKIARDLGLKVNIVSNIKNRETYRDVPWPKD